MKTLFTVFALATLSPVVRAQDVAPPQPTTSAAEGSELKRIA
jgi:hypothetical protein